VCDPKVQPYIHSSIQIDYGNWVYVKDLKRLGKKVYIHKSISKFLNKNGEDSSMFSIFDDTLQFSEKIDHLFINRRYPTVLQSAINLACILNNCTVKPDIYLHGVQLNEGWEHYHNGVCSPKSPRVIREIRAEVEKLQSFCNLYKLHESNLLNIPQSNLNFEL